MVLERDSDIQLPQFVVLKASAGSGKTHALTLRIVQLLLSERIPGNRLRNVLAVTFSNNAAKEMKARTLEWLKAVCLGKEEETANVAALLSLDRDEIRERAERLLDEMIGQYADVQIQTIDSFMAGIFRASAIDLGYQPDFEIVMSGAPLLGAAFDFVLKDVKEGSALSGFLEGVIEGILETRPVESPYPWNPTSAILAELKDTGRALAATWTPLRLPNPWPAMRECKEEILDLSVRIEEMIHRSGIARNGNSTFPAIFALAGEDRFPEIIGKGLKTPPVRKCSGKDETLRQAFGEILMLWDSLGDAVRRYAMQYALACPIPYLAVHAHVQQVVERLKRQEEQVFIEDINRKLAGYIDGESVPDIYFRLGDTVTHFLIDEFQDTSPVQWRNLLPLIGNALAGRGSLFLVGDTKQAIYGFRNADFRIMKELSVKNPFPSAAYHVRELEVSRRSQGRLIAFGDRVFKDMLVADERYGDAARESGLTDYVQRPARGVEDKGYVEVREFERDDMEPEREAVHEILAGLRERGYGWKDIAVLTAENEDVVRITSWLNEREIPFISYSSLDARRRKITGEIIALLRFLDSPLDDLSFASFLAGEVFAEATRQVESALSPAEVRGFLFRSRDAQPLYKAFREAWPSAWEGLFEGLFRSTGYLSLYDLLSEFYRTFRVFDHFPREEATLARLLEAVKNFEGRGSNTLRDFLEYAESEESPEAEWDIAVPKETEAVRVMTVHKAKGLGFPVVILVLYGKQRRGFGNVPWEEGRNGVTLIRVNQSLADKVGEIGALYERLKMAEDVNSLNSLYVALTRAEAEMYILCVRKQGRNEHFHPCRFIPTAEYRPAERPAETYPGEREAVARLPLVHGEAEPERAAAGPGRLRIAERRRGECIHRVLSRIGYLDDMDEDRLAAIVEEEIASEEGLLAEGIGEILRDFFAIPEAAESFRRREGRSVESEKEYCDADGNLYRIDRVVIDAERVLVIDFKTGGERGSEEDHERQVEAYMRILSTLYRGRRIAGRLAYLDLRKVKEIG